MHRLYNSFLFLLILTIGCKNSDEKKLNHQDLNSKVLETENGLKNMIPFKFIKNQILVEVFINSKGPYNMIFDTGVTPSTIDIKIAKELNLVIDTSNEGQATGRGTKKIQLFPAIISNMTVGNINLDSLSAVTLDHEFLGKVLGQPLHGILGHSMLKNRIFKIDYIKKEIHFFDSREDLDNTLKGKDFFKEVFIYEKGDIIPIIKNFKINDNPFIASLDTGSSLGVEVFEHHFDKFQIEKDTSKTYQITGAQGKDQGIDVLIDKFTIGSQTFSVVKGGVTRVKDTVQLKQGNIGNNFLKSFKVSFDYSNKEVIFESNE